MHTHSVEKLPHTASARTAKEWQTLPGSQTIQSQGNQGLVFHGFSPGVEKGGLDGRGHLSDEHGFRNFPKPQWMGTCNR